jgi:hypothetical protein
MSIIGLIRKFGSKVGNKIEDHLATVLSASIILILSTLGILFWKWLKTKHSFEIYNWTWILVASIFVFLFGHFLFRIFRDRGRLKNPRDIINAIDNWLSEDINGRPSIYSEGPFYLSAVEKSLNLKRGSRKYLPMVAWKHGYRVESGKKTFKLSKLTLNNDPTNVLESYLKPLLNGEKEITLMCGDIDRELTWPKGATRTLLLSRPLKNVNFGIEIEDIGRDKIRIIRKE